MALPTPGDDVVARVKSLAAASSRPALTDAEVIATISAHPLVDRYDILADGDGWTPTWDINAAVAECYSIKAAKVSGDFNFAADNATFSKGEVMAQLLAMEAHWTAKAAGSMNTGAGYSNQLRGLIVNG